MEQQRPTSQKLPAGLAGVLNAPDENRDSAYFSSTDASSKRESTSLGSRRNRDPLADSSHPGRHVGGLMSWYGRPRSAGLGLPAVSDR